MILLHFFLRNVWLKIALYLRIWIEFFFYSATSVHRCFSCFFFYYFYSVISFSTFFCASSFIFMFRVFILFAFIFVLQCKFSVESILAFLTSCFIVVFFAKASTTALATMLSHFRQQLVRRESSGECSS